MLFALLHKDSLIGLYNDYKKCKNMMDGLVSNKFTQLKHLSIVRYFDNSILIDTSDLVEHFTTEETTDTSDSSESEKELDKETLDKINKKKEKQSKIIYNLTLLKKEKEKLEEKKLAYKTDYELFKKFNKIKADNSSFTIPELFQEKYKIMTELQETDNLNWDSFNKKYIVKDLNTSYDKILDKNDIKYPGKKLLDVSSTESESATDTESESGTESV